MEYKCKMNIKHNGVLYMVGETIDLEESEAKDLLKSEIIVQTEESSREKPESSKEKSVRSMEKREERERLKIEKAQLKREEKERLKIEKARLKKTSATIGRGDTAIQVLPLNPPPKGEIIIDNNLKEKDKK